MLSCLVTKHPLLVLKLFNLVLDQNCPLPEWSLGMITPIFKKGRRCDPNNYRGIFLLSSFGKLFLSLVTNRLSHFVQERKILSNSQLGFMQGNRTSDAHLTLHNLIRKYCHKNNSKMYSCFVDFSKAFDTLPRDILFEKLLAYGVNGKFFNTIKNMYSNDRACLKIGNIISNTFDINQGVRQGCVLSPLLFNIFMADLPKHLNSSMGYVKVDDLQISCIIWADDIVILSETEVGLSESLNILEKYCNQNILKINADKTKCMIFNKTGRLIRKTFYLGNTKLDSVRSYKYLGFIFTPSGEINTGLYDLRDRALKAFMKIKNAMGLEFNRNIQTTLHIINSLVMPIALYASDFWGCMKLAKGNPIDTLNLRICKQLLGVQKQTTSIGVLLELGRIPLHIDAIKLSIKNWERIRKGNANKIICSSYLEAVNLNLPWIDRIRFQLESNGMWSFFLNQYADKPVFIYNKIYQRLSDIFHQEAFNTITSDGSKLRTYGLVKKNIGFENYLSDIKNVKDRRILSKFRLSNHSLMIERGRFTKTPREERLCPFCVNLVECEIHFILHCPMYQTLRVKFLKDVIGKNLNYEHYTDVQKFQYILSHKGPLVPRFIKSCVELREQLVL